MKRTGEKMPVSGGGISILLHLRVETFNQGAWVTADTFAGKKQLLSGMRTG